MHLSHVFCASQCDAVMSEERMGWMTKAIMTDRLHGLRYELVLTHINVIFMTL